jgi:hypothetical protein
MFVEQKPEARRGDSSMLAICVPKRIPSTKGQSDGCNCGVYTCLSWSMFVAVERSNPGLWTNIETLADLDKEIVKPFWDLHENKEDRMINF